MTPYEDTDKDFRGYVNEDGLEWHGDLNCYIPNDWTISMSISNWDGVRKPGHVLIGKGEILLTELEWKTARDLYGDDYTGLNDHLLTYHKNPNWTEEDQERKNERDEMFRDNCP